MLQELSLVLLVEVHQGLRNRQSHKLLEALLMEVRELQDHFLELHQLLVETLLLADWVM